MSSGSRLLVTSSILGADGITGTSSLPKPSSPRTSSKSSKFTVSSRVDLSGGAINSLGSTAGISGSSNAASKSISDAFFSSSERLLLGFLNNAQAPAGLRSR